MGLTNEPSAFTSSRAEPERRVLGVLRSLLMGCGGRAGVGGAAGVVAGADGWGVGCVGVAAAGAGVGVGAGTTGFVCA